jgi:signal transduction histidine kinase
MKLDKTYLFIGISSIALVIVLVIQVNWILETAKIKEELFNEKAHMVLSKTAEVLSNDKAAMKSMQVDPDKCEVYKIDSLFNHYMTVYNIKIKYFFELNPRPSSAVKGYADNSSSYQTCLSEGHHKQGLELKLVFPDKKQFIIAEMGTMFITSVLLILVVLVMYWRTILSLLREKRISENTTDFLNNMTHEFKTPLTNIALAGKMICKESNIREEDKVRHYSSIIVAENEKLRLQVEQVLSMTALERGEIPLNKEKLDFHRLITDSLKCISLQTEVNGGQINTEFLAQQYYVIGDKFHLANALCNLIDNAIKYSGASPQITIRTLNDNQHLVIEVSDKGIGIDKADQKQVFNKFFRVSTGDIHNVKGFGLGLFYTKWIIELHDGKIDLHSTKGEGSTFIIRLPHA